MRKKRNTYRVLMGKPKGGKQLRRPKCRWEDNIKNIFRHCFNTSSVSQHFGAAPQIKPIAFSVDPRNQKSRLVENGKLESIYRMGDFNDVMI
jgi:hypothetical protein